MSTELDKAIQALETLQNQTRRVYFLAENSGRYHFRQYSNGEWAVLDCSKGLHFLGRNFPHLIAAVDAAMVHAKENPRAGGL